LTLLRHLLWYARFPITVRHVDALFLGRGMFAVWAGGRTGWVDVSAWKGIITAHCGSGRKFLTQSNAFPKRHAVLLY
jgi:hypothetical protein